MDGNQDIPSFPARNLSDSHLLYRSLAFIGLGKSDEALKGLEVYLNKEERPEAKLLIHLLVARINKQLKNPTTAAVHVNHALKIDSMNEEALRLYVQLKGRAGELYAEATDFLLKNQPQKAIECLKHAVRSLYTPLHTLKYVRIPLKGRAGNDMQPKLTSC